MFIRVLCSVIVLLLAVSGQEKKTAEVAKLELPAPTNLKVLKLTTGAEVGQVMRTFTAGLGVQCSYCHVEGSYASDENPKKEVARRMIKLSRVVNADFDDGKLHVSCFTCHRGDVQPRTAPTPEAKPAT
jgi:hypothetical protein